jgi:hypothetical protein
VAERKKGLNHEGHEAHEENDPENEKRNSKLKVSGIRLSKQTAG